MPSVTSTHRPLSIENRNIDDLVPYKRNSKIHDKKQVKQIAASIQEFGFNVPVLIDEQNRIIAGHGRVLAAKQLGMAEVPTIAIDHLTDAQRRAFIIADNKLTENSSWNTEMLALEFKELGALDLSFDLEITGFNTSEMDLILLDETKENSDADVIPDIDENMPAICKPGDIWQLGDHRLICGDSTKSETYEHLLGDRRADQRMLGNVLKLIEKLDLIEEEEKPEEEEKHSKGDWESMFAFFGKYEKLIKQEIERLKETNPSYWNFSDWYHPTLERAPWYEEIYGKNA